MRLCKSSDGTLFIHHTFFIYPAAELFKIVKEFLSAHPKELLQMKFKWTDTQSVTDLSAQIGQELSNSGLLPMTIPHLNRHDPIRDLVSYNKRLFIFIDHIASSPAIPECPFAFQKIANSVCIDFVQPSLTLAEWLLTNGSSSK